MCQRCWISILNVNIPDSTPFVISQNPPIQRWTDPHAAPLKRRSEKYVQQRVHAITLRRQAGVRGLHELPERAMALPNAAGVSRRLRVGVKKWVR